MLGKACVFMLANLALLLDRGINLIGNFRRASLTQKLPMS
jgi:hypothetical protein